jgi:cob(I)alamin adenosyltransferase
MSEDITTVEGLARLVRQTRLAQQRYFACKGGKEKAGLLQEARDHERRLDRAVDLLLYPPQPGLFDKETP